MKLLINEHPLLVLPSLATAVGLNEAIFLQQLHYWIENKNTQGKTADGRKWIRNTIQEWTSSNFPFWDIGVIKRVTKNLSLDGLVDSRSDLNKLPIDRTKWYSINYAALERLSRGGEPVERIARKKRKRQKAVETRSDITTRREHFVPIGKEQSVPMAKEQIDLSNGTKCTVTMEQSVSSITRDYTETTSEIKEEKEEAPPAPPRLPARSQSPSAPPPSTTPEPAPTDPIAQGPIICDLYRNNISMSLGPIQHQYIESDIVDLDRAGYDPLQVFTYAITQTALNDIEKPFKYMLSIIADVRDSKKPLAAYISHRQAKTKRNGGPNGHSANGSGAGTDRADGNDPEGQRIEAFVAGLST